MVEKKRVPSKGVARAPDPLPTWLGLVGRWGGSQTVVVANGPDPWGGGCLTLQMRKLRLR